MSTTMNFMKFKLVWGDFPIFHRKCYFFLRMMLSSMKLYKGVVMGVSSWSTLLSKVAAPNIMLTKQPLSTSICFNPFHATTGLQQGHHNEGSRYALHPLGWIRLAMIDFFETTIYYVAGMWGAFSISSVIPLWIPCFTSHMRASKDYVNLIDWSVSYVTLIAYVLLFSLSFFFTLSSPFEGYFPTVGLGLLTPRRLILLRWGLISLKEIIHLIISRTFSPRVLGDIPVIYHIMAIKMMVNIIFGVVRPIPRSWTSPLAFSSSGRPVVFALFVGYWFRKLCLQWPVWALSLKWL